jgi:hypothetical protein
MNVDRILKTFNRHKVAYLVIGGVNFMLRHAPVLTYDVDLWVEDTEENLARCAAALAALRAEWGPTDADWGPVARLPAGWLRRRPLFCLTSPHGAVDIFRTVRGLPDWRGCCARAHAGRTGGGVPYRGLSDRDTLRSQAALPAADRKPDRMRVLRAALRRRRR